MRKEKKYGKMNTDSEHYKGYLEVTKNYKKEKYKFPENCKSISHYLVLCARNLNLGAVDKHQCKPYRIRDGQYLMPLAQI